MIKIAIDLGASLTKIYRAGKGIQLCEPTCFAVNVENRRIRAIGEDAKNLGKNGGVASLHYPVRRGEVVDEKGAIALLRRFLDKIELKANMRENVHALFLVPCGIRGKTCTGYYRVGQSLGFGKISFLETPYALAEGLSLDWETPVFCMDIGAGLTNVALFSKEGMIAGIAIGVGGKDIDRAIGDHVASSTGVRIPLSECEALKNEVGSLYEGDGMSLTVRGRKQNEEGKVALLVMSEHIIEPILEPLDTIIRYTKMLVEKIPPDLFAPVFQKGLNLSGGVASLPGLREYLEQHLGLEVFDFGENGRVAAVLGAGKMLEDAQLLKEYQVRY